MSACAMRGRDLIGPVVLVAFFVGIMLLVPPRGEFPINDDWDYVATVADLVRYGEIRLSDWPGMSLVGQIFWGGLFAKLFGLSYMTLRLSVIALALVGAVALYHWARAIERTRAESLFLALLYATNPLVFSLSYSFMTDVPAASMMLLCLLIQAHCARRGGVLLYLLAGVIAALGYLIREIAALPALVLAASMVPAVVRSRGRARELLALTAPLALVFTWHSFWLDHIHGRPYQAAVGRLQFPQLDELLIQLLWQPLAVGFYLSPLVMCLIGRRARALVWRSIVARVLVVGLVLFGLPWLSAAPLPPYVQYINDFYLGFETLDAMSLQGPWIPVGSVYVSVFVWCLSAVGLVSLSLAVGFVAVELRARWTRWRHRELGLLPLSPGNQAGVCGLALLGFLLVQSTPFDRYLLPVVPTLAMFLLSLMPRGLGLLRSPLAWVLLAVFAVFSVVGTQDYFARARVRWQAIGYLLEAGVKPPDISAGFEHAALWCFSPHYRRPARVRPYLLELSEAERLAHLKREDPTLLWRQPREYEVTYKLVPAAALVAAFKYGSWIRTGYVLVYRWPKGARHD